VEPLTAGDLTIDVAPATDAALLCTWKGRSNDRQPGKVLNPYFESLLAEAAAAKIALEMRFEGLDHFNSSTITVLIRLIQNARTRSVPLIFVYAAELKWQRLSFEALRVFDKGDKAFELRTV
jgi:hypothetical protein